MGLLVTKRTKKMKPLKAKLIRILLLTALIQTEVRREIPQIALKKKTKVATKK